MSKQVYISADYDQSNGDQNVVDELNKWGSDSLHKVDFIDMSKVSSGSVANSVYADAFKLSAHKGAAKGNVSLRPGSRCRNTCGI